ncbi:MAG: FMN-binding glutamate synthase family protein [Candidatus Hydrogenedens sp.]|nr:FMN-binding glutamate synthase family protein [Candidatus Hydrogenedens sp.]
MEDRVRELNQFFAFRIHGRRFLIAGAATLAAIGLLGWWWHAAWWAFALVVPVFGIGVADMLQTKNTIIRNFPFLGHFRYLSLMISPEIHQYFVENDTDGKPFNKTQRAFVSKRADQRPETHPFGTQQDVYALNYEWAAHSIYPKPVADSPPRVRIGGDACRQPYDAALLNISAMSYGSLSSKAILALNQGAKMGGFFHDTGEGAISEYHLAHGADLVWEIGSGYFGCRTADGGFSEETFQEKAATPSVKMIEIKLSQGAKPGHGGVLPGSKNTPEIAKIRGVEPYTTVVSPAYHKAFSDAEGLLRFVQRLRDLSDGKPVGFKLCVGERREFIDICRAMNETGIRPDFITVDGSEGGTGAAPIEYSDSVGMPLEEALVFVHDTLRGYGLKQHIRLIVAGKIITGFDIVKAIALGADVCNSARGMMFALGCIQALKCDTGECPTGVATHDPALTRGLVVKTKSQRVANFQAGTVRAAQELVAAMGLDSFEQLTRAHIIKRTALNVMQSFEELYPTAPEGSYPEQ